MISKTSSLSLFCFITLLFVTHGFAQQQEITGESIVGTYVIGHSYGGSALTLEADGSYTIESGDCTTEYYDAGTYVFSGNILRFNVAKKTAKQRGGERELNLLELNDWKEMFPGDAPAKIEKEFKLIPVKWSDRIYLMDEKEIKNFFNAINLGVEPRSELRTEHYLGGFYLRKGDEQKKVNASPSLPEEQLSFLLNKAVSVTVVSIAEDANEKVATVNKGSRDGLKVGMRLMAKEQEPSLLSEAVIVSVEERSAKVSIDSELKVGDKLSTKYEAKVYR